MNKIDELRERLRQHGYKLEKVRSFKNYDRVTFSSKQAVFSVNLRTHLSEANFEAVVDACVRRKTGKVVS